MKKDIIPLFISTLLMIISIAAILFSDFNINIKHYIGFILIPSSLILYFKRKDIYFYFFGITLTTGTLGFIDFFFIGFGFRIGIFQINPLIAILLLIFLIQNRQRLFPIQEGEKEPDESRVNTFKEKFKEKSENELAQIANSNSSYVYEARIAAEHLLKEKNVL